MRRADGARTTVSLSVDRTNGGGYRRVEDVAKVPDLAALMLRDAINDAIRFVKKYDMLSEMAGKGPQMYALMQEWIEERQNAEKAAAELPAAAD